MALRTCFLRSQFRSHGRTPKLGQFRPQSLAPKMGELHVLARGITSESSNKSLLAKVWDGTHPQSLTKDKTMLSKEDADKFNRWSIFPMAFLIQIPTGAVYAWSMWAPPLTQTLGVVGASALDWGLGPVSMTFSSLAVGFGISVGLLGPWIERVGPRYASLVGGALFGGGHLLSAVGCYMHTIPLIWLGWGLMGGIGWGLGYLAPIGLLTKWFPDRKGMATGLAISAFASGGLVAAPSIQYLRTKFFTLPTYAGPLGSIDTKTEAGKQYVMYQGDWCEAILAKASDLSVLPSEISAKLAEGFYLVDTGDNGCVMTFAVLGLGYMASMGLGSQLLREPPAGWAPPGWTPPVASGVVAAGSVSASTAMRTPQFYLMWLTLAANASAGVCVITSAKMMMGDIFANINPDLVTAGFTTGFVGALSLANAGGRLGWAGVSDHIGRKNTMFVTSLALPACMLIPQITQLAATGDGTLPLYMFYGTSFMIVSWYGGVLALIPSYAADVFGPKHSGVIYGRLMTGWSFSAICTPGLLATLRGMDQRKAIDSLVANTSPEVFQQTFKAPIAELDSLLAAKTVTIARLMEIAPLGTVDPSPFLYDTTFYAISGILATAAISNALIRKVDSKYLMVEDSVNKDRMSSKEDKKDERLLNDKSS